MDSLDVPPKRPPPPPPPPAPASKRLSRPKITLQMPDNVTPTTQRGPTTGQVYWGPPMYHGKGGHSTPATHMSDPNNPYFNPFMHMYHNKASDFMFKQFAGFKDFTMNTAKSGLSAGEKSAFWFYNKLRMLSKKWFTHLFLTLCLVLYSVMGAGIFMALEGAQEREMNLTDVRHDIVASLEKYVNGSTILKQNETFAHVIEQHILYYASNQTVCTKEFICTDDVRNASEAKTWGFWNAMFYAGTIYTTIGYGHIAPTTFYGRVATIVYAVIGIPLFLIVLADFGKLFTRIIKFFWSFIRRFYYTRSCRKVRRTVPVQEVMKGLNVMYDVVRRPSQIFSEEEMQDNVEGIHPPILQRKPSDGPPPLPPKPGTVISKDPDDETEPNTPAPSVFEIDDEFNLPISVAIIILVIYIICGAVVYSIWEKWNFFESFYFVFISMSTIGLGDLVPDHPIFMMCSILYLVFGLALTSMCINVVQLKLSNTFKQASAKLGATIGLKVAEEDGSLVPETPPATEIAPVHKPKALKEDSKSKDDKDNDSKNR